MSAGTDHDRSVSEDTDETSPGHKAAQGDLAETAPVERTGRRKRRSGYVVAAGVLAVAVGGGTAAALVMNDGGDDSAGAGEKLPAATAPITRGDVVDTESVDGKLTYAEERTVAAGTSGVVTWAPAAGATIERGKTLLSVANKPITLMYGSLPLYRTLKDGIDNGADVRQLEANLKALGYGDDMTVDKEFTDETAEAVEKWQDDRGLEETGSVDAGQVVFEPGAVRVKEVKAAKGGQVAKGGAAMTVTGTAPIVHVDLDAAKQNLAKKGATVTVELPNGDRVKGKIIDVGTVATAGSGQDNNDKSTVDVDIKLSEKTGRLDQAPVSVDLESGRAKNVLSVPIEALLGLREGGFGIEVIENGTARIVPVQTGTFGGGRVQVTANGLREGMKVGVPSS